MDPNLAVLVDVDKTLLIGENGKLNEELVGALKACGIDQVYLFTSMSLTDMVDKMATPKNTSRPDLIALLKDQGIRVLSVLTPADVEHKKGLGRAYQDYYVPQYARYTAGKLTLESYPKDVEFNSARECYSVLNNKVQSQTSNDGSVTLKSLLFAYFIKHKDIGINRILVIDDDKIHLAAIEGAANSLQDVTVKCIEVHEHDDEAYFKKQIKTIFPKKSWLARLGITGKSQKVISASSSASASASTNDTSVSPRLSSSDCNN